MDKNDFFKIISNNVFYPEMLIFMEIWTKKHFFNKRRFRQYIDIFENIYKKRVFKVFSFSRNFDINGFMDKKLFYQNDVKKRNFP